MHVGRAVGAQTVFGTSASDGCSETAGGKTSEGTGYPADIPSFFLPRSGWKKRMLALAAAEIRRQEAAGYARYLPGWKRKLRRYFNPRSFYLTPEGLTFYEHLGEKGVRGINFYGPGGEVLEFCRDEALAYHGKSGLTGWSHLALKVENMESTENFYGKMGFRTISRGYLSTPEGDIQIHYLEKAGFVIEVLEMIGSGLEELRQRKEGRLDHIALRVRNAREAFDEARKSGFSMRNHTIQELPLLEKGIRFFFVSGPDGEKVEFVEKI